ncbi:hypothetical protein TNCV_40071 [Trichonephila clavipes]|nr:hypothetical protein TNCV_40071 [Trichonephila clavipes]
MVDELWHRVEAAWESVPVHSIQSPFDSMPRRISAVLTTRVFRYVATISVAGSKTPVIERNDVSLLSPGLNKLIPFASTVICVPSGMMLQAEGLCAASDRSFIRLYENTLTIDSK